MRAGSEGSKNEGSKNEGSKNEGLNTEVGSDDLGGDLEVEALTHLILEMLGKTRLGRGRRDCIVGCACGCGCVRGYLYV
jgi:hypothetical protein